MMNDELETKAVIPKFIIAAFIIHHFPWSGYNRTGIDWKLFYTPYASELG